MKKHPLLDHLDTAGRGEQARIAREIGVSATVLSLIVTGKREPSLAQARAIDKATGGKVAFASWATPIRRL